MHRFAFVLALAGLAAAAPAAVAAPPDSTCVFMVSMTSGTDVNNLDFVVDYTNTFGNVEGTPTNPECARALGGQSFASFHDDDDGHLNVGLIRLDYFSAPVDLVACRIFYDDQKPQPGDFQIQVTNAGRDGGDNNVSPTPTLVVSDVDCPGELPNVTTTTTTTTTLVANGDCGRPVSNGNDPTASDALFALKAAVGGADCDLCFCDVNSNGSIAASDALAILRAAVGIPTVLDCPAC
jgi:hypothetical protein